MGRRIPAPRATSRRSGFTLMEILVSTAIILVLLGGVWALFDIFIAFEERGQRETARARLMRGLNTQMQDDISQATLGMQSPRLLLNTLVVVKPPKPEGEEAEGDSNGGDAGADAGGNPTNSDGSSDGEEAATTTTTTTGTASAALTENSESDPNSDASQQNGLANAGGLTNQATEDANGVVSFGNSTQGYARPIEYATLIGNRSWLMLEMPNKPGDDLTSANPASTAGSNQLSNSPLQRTGGAAGATGSAQGEWVARPGRKRVLYHFVAPEDLLREEDLTLGLTRWEFDSQSVPLSTLLSELYENKFGTTESAIWQQPQQGAGSALSFLVADQPKIVQEKVPELRRIVFRYYGEDGWQSSWSSVGQRRLPKAIQMRVLWNDPRMGKPQVDEFGRPIESEERFSERDALEEIDLLINWDEEFNSEFSFSASSDTAEPPPQGYGEYFFLVPASNGRIDAWLEGESPLGGLGGGGFGGGFGGGIQ